MISPLETRYPTFGAGLSSSMGATGTVLMSKGWSVLPRVYAYSAFSRLDNDT